MLKAKMMMVGMGAIALATLAGCETPSTTQANTPDQTQVAEQSSPTSNSSSTDSSSTLSATDQTFLTKAAQGGLAEVQLGQLAARNASSQTVKDFAQRMVTDHTQANNQLQQIASQKGITLPTDIGEENRAMAEQLSGLTGTEFDRQYMQHMVEDHSKNVAEYQQQAQQGQDPDLKSFAAQTLPTLQDHLQLARSVADTTGSSGSSSSNSPSSSSQPSTSQPSSP